MSSMNPIAVGNYNYDHNVTTGVYFRKILFRRSGTYNHQFHRSYEAHVNPQTLRVLAEKANQQNSPFFNPAGLTGIASNMLSISALPENPNPIFIPNGWDTQRLVFFMDILVKDMMGSERIYYVQGYTDYVGMSLQSKQFDPQMVMFINNIVEGKQTAQMASISKTDHVLYNYSPQNNDVKLSMRPTDVFNVMATSNFANSAGVGMTNVTDRRARLTAKPSLSKRTNAVASNYTCNMLNSFMRASDDLSHNVGFDSNPSSVFDSASNEVGENLASINPFLSALSRNSRTGIVSGYFSWGDLCQLDPNLMNSANNIVKVIESGSTQLHQRHMVGQTMDWQGGQIETKYAATISQSVPAIMMESMLANVVFKVSNMMNFEGNYSGMVTTIMNANAMHGGVCVREAEMFKRRFEIEVMRDISFNNQQKFDITVESSIYGETKMSISIDGGPYIDYVTPTFCDGIITPIITQDINRLHDMASSMETLVTQLSDATQSGHNNHFQMLGSSVPMAMNQQHVTTTDTSYL